MDAAYGALILLVLILVAFAALGKRMMGYYGDFTARRFPRALASQVQFAPGDIILFNSSVHGFTNSAVTRDFFSHAGIIVRDPETGRLFVSDSSGSEVMPAADGAEYTTRMESMYLPLYARLKYYTGEIYHLHLMPGLTDRQADYMWDLVQERVPYPGALQSLAGLLHLPRWVRSSGPSRHCMEHVAWLRDELGLTPTDLLTKGATIEHPGFIPVCKAVPGIGGKRLGVAGTSCCAPPVQVMYDLDCMDSDALDMFNAAFKPRVAACP